MNELAELLDKYTDGQFEVADMGDLYLGRGTIASIDLLDTEIPIAQVRLQWIAFYDHATEEWHLGNRLTFMIPMDSFSLFHGDRLFVKHDNEGLCFALPGDTLLAPDEVMDFKPPDTIPSK